jgi:exopolyphosphatase/guanosine-5'-triphosphate,3'-diphosphate pyrophosphatase
MTDHLRFRKEIEGYGMDWYEFVACILVYGIFLKLVKTSTLVFPEINLRDGMIAEMIEKDHGLDRYKVFNNDVISLARNASVRYKSSTRHCREVEKNGILIMDELKKHFTFNERDELLMRLAAILHEIGKFTRAKDYLAASFHKIRNLSIMGTNYHEMMLVAYICKMLEDSQSSRASIERLGESDQNLILKLSAILSIADALDKSKKQKIKIKGFEVTDDEFRIMISKSTDTTLEEWNFENREKEFISAFGLAPRLVEGEYDE